MTLKLSRKAKSALNKVVARFRSGDLSPVVKLAGTVLDPDSPMANWSWGNRLLAVAGTGDLDVRGYGQWLEVGRKVNVPHATAFILRPVPRQRTEKNDAGEEEVVAQWTDYVGQAVFGISQTAPLPDWDGPTVEEHEEPTVLPDLADLAERLGVEVKTALMFDAYGSCDVEGKVIKLASPEEQVFFHELGHAVDAQLNGVLKGGQHSDQEVRAEFASCVLMELYGVGDSSGNAWRYISHYAKDPIDAVHKAMGRVGDIIAVIEDARGEG